MKELTESQLRDTFEFDIYYTGSLNLAYLHPHYGHILQEDIMLDGKLVPAGYMLFYGFASPFEAMSPEEWSRDSRHCYKVDKDVHEDRVKTWTWAEGTFPFVMAHDPALIPECYLVTAYFGAWDPSLFTIGVFSSMEKAKAAQEEFEKTVDAYKALNPFPGYDEDIDETSVLFRKLTPEEEVIYDNWQYGGNHELLQYDGCSITKFDIDQIRKWEDRFGENWGK